MKCHLKLHIDININITQQVCYIVTVFFLPRDAMLARYLLSSYLSVHHKPVFYRNDWTNRAGFSHGGFLSPI